VISDFNVDVTQRMLEFASAKAKKLGLEIVQTVHVPALRDSICVEACAG